MSGACEYCGEPCETPTACFTIVSSGFRRANDEQVRFCSVECRTWWRRRYSDHPGAWEQPAPNGYKGRLSKFGDDDDAPSASVTASAASTARQVATDGGRVEDAPIAVFVSERAPGWEWQALRIERETPETVYYGRVRSPLTNGRWEFGTFSESELESADAREIDDR